MTNRGIYKAGPALLLALMLIAAWFTPSFADESTAHLIFKKTASSKKTTTYLVKKGDLLSRIIAQQLGPLTPEKEKALYRAVRKLNPGLKDKDRIYPGQVLVLPVDDSKEEKEERTAASSAYQTKRGDTLIRIIHRELGVRGRETLKTLKLVQQLNPGIRNVNRIYPGQRLNLPEGGRISTMEEVAGIEEENQAVVTEKEPDLDKAVLPTEARMAVVRHVLGRMNASIMTSGFFFIPIPDTGQATIDCAMIPVVEFDDGSTVLLDFTNRMHDTLKTMIEAKWGNISMVKASSREDSATILSKAISASRSYTMTRQSKPLPVGGSPPVDIAVDWLIAKKTSEGKSYRQALTFIKDKSHMLDKTLSGFAERNGLIMTDVENETVISATDEERKSSPELTVLNTSTDSEVVTALLMSLGYMPERDVEVTVFDPVKDGFNLTVRADYLLKIPGRSPGGVESAETEKTATKAQKKTAVTNSDDWGVVFTVKAKTNIRAKRSLGSKLKGQLAEGRKIRADFLKDGWYAVFKLDERVRDENRALGYVFAPRLTEGGGASDQNEATPSRTTAEETASDKTPVKEAEVKGKAWGTVFSVKSRTNIRTGRAIGSKLKGKLEVGQKIKVDFLEDDWYAVFKLDEQVRDESRALGYVFAPRLTADTPATAKAETVKTVGPGNSGADRRIIFHSKKLPQQFANILRLKGTEIVYINQGDTKKALIEKILVSLGLPSAYTGHVFSIPETGRSSRITISLPAFKIVKNKESVYLVDYTVDPDIYSLLHQKWGVNVVKF